MEKDPKTEFDVQEEIQGILPAAIAVVTRPHEFYGSMRKSGGFLGPLFFMVVLGAVSGLLAALLSLVGLAPADAFVTGLAAVILMPVFIAIFGFIGAAILFVIWKAMGSAESFETAYRGMAYTAAILPVTTVIDIIPYLGGIVGLVWMTWLLVIVSTTVHNIRAKTAWTVFGAVCVVFVLATVSLEATARRMAAQMDGWDADSRNRMEQLQDMSPEEAGKAMGEFLKGLQQSADEQQP